MKRVILFMILSIVSIGLISCGEKVFPQEDSVIASFSYRHFDSYFNYGGYQHLKKDPNEFKNTEEKNIKSEKDVMKLAKNELDIEYNESKIFYDKSKAMWLVTFYQIDEQSGSSYRQIICMDDKGITQLIGYSTLPKDVSIDKIQSFVYEPEWEENMERDRTTFQNKEESVIKTRQDVIALAQKELLWEYDDVFVSYDELNGVWMVSFSINAIGIRAVQNVFIDSKGITILCGSTMYKNIVDDVISCHIDDRVEALELSGGIRRNSDEYKNTTETEVTKEKIVELAKNEVTIEYDQIFVGYDKSENVWEVIFWVCEDEYEDPGVGQYVFIDDKGITQLVIDRPFVFSDYKEYIEFLENLGGKTKHSNSSNNQTELVFATESNLRERSIELAKNELSEGYEYERIVVYYDTLLRPIRVVVSFWADDTFTKGEHVFINPYGVAELIMYTD